MTEREEMSVERVSRNALCDNIGLNTVLFMCYYSPQVFYVWNIQASPVCF